MARGSNALIPTRADTLRLVEACYEPAEDHDEWARRFITAARDVLGFGLPGYVLHRHSADLTEWDPLALVTPHLRDEARRRHREMLPNIGLEGLRALFYPSSLVTTHLELDAHLSPESQETLRDYRRVAMGIHDALGIVVHPEPAVVGVFFLGTAHEIVVTPHARRLLSQVALHLEASLRLRLRPESVTAVIDAAGNVVHHVPGAPPAAALSARAKRIDRARTRRHRFEPRSIDVWTALVAGQASLIERWDGGKRYYFVLENAPAAQPFRAMTRGEIDALTQAARGLSAKLVAYALGISQSTVSSRLASAASKIGLSTRLELVRLAAMLAREPRAASVDLTGAERDVLDLVAQGLTNMEIARIRNRSVRTIANQVAGLLRKTDSPTRRALVTRAL